MQFELMVFLCGTVGALSPEVVRLYKLRYKPLEFSRSYFFISLAFCLLGGFVALILQSTTLWGAFYTGLSLPLIVSTSIGKPPRYVQELAMGSAPTRPAPSSWREYLGVLYSR